MAFFLARRLLSEVLFGAESCWLRRNQLGKSVSGRGNNERKGMEAGPCFTAWKQSGHGGGMRWGREVGGRSDGALELDGRSPCFHLVRWGGLQLDVGLSRPLLSP